MLASLLIIELLGCSILSLCLGKDEKSVYLVINSSAFDPFTSDGYSALIDIFLSLFFWQLYHLLSALLSCVAEASKVANFWIWKLYIAWEVIISLYVCNTLNYIMQTWVNILCFRTSTLLHFLDNLIHWLNLIGRCRIAICFGWIGLVWETWWLLCSKWFWEFHGAFHTNKLNKLALFLLIEKLGLLIVLLQVFLMMLNDF